MCSRVRMERWIIDLLLEVEQEDDRTTGPLWAGVKVMDLLL